MPSAFVQSGKDGRFSYKVVEKDVEIDLVFEKEGYAGFMLAFARIAEEEHELLHRVDWGEAATIPYAKGDELEKGVRRLFASEDCALSERAFLNYLLKYVHELRPPLRKLIKDPKVGESVKDWLDLLGDPGDRDLFPKGREYAPKHQIREVDLVEAIKAIARHLNFFSSRPEPKIDIEFIVFNSDMDLALVQCGINMAPFTGILWRFVFCKDGKNWVLRSMQEAGRG
jgi:hypothetical protein